MKWNTVIGMTLVVALLALIVAVHEDGQAIAGAAKPKVPGKWEGTWSHRAGSGQITLQLAQEGTKVTGKVNVGGAIPVFDTERGPMNLGQEVREGTLEGSTLIFNVAAPDSPSKQINFTLTVSGENMTGTACGYTCATVKLKKSKL
jgi:hypothetical protein